MQCCQNADLKSSLFQKLNKSASQVCFSSVRNLDTEKIFNKFQILQTTPKEEQKTIIRKLKEEQRRKMALLGEQYEQTIADMLQKQSVNIY